MPIFKMVIDVMRFLCILVIPGMSFHFNAFKEGYPAFSQTFYLMKKVGVSRPGASRLGDVGGVTPPKVSQ